jgi:hypothetical protein
MLILMTALLASPAMAGDCPSDDEVLLFSSGKTAAYVALGGLQVAPTATGLSLVGLGEGDDRILDVAAGVVSIGSPSGQTPRGGESLNILDRGEAGDNVIFDERSSLGVTADDTVVELDAGDTTLTIFTGPTQIVVQAACDDGSALGVLFDAGVGELVVARDKDGKLSELGSMNFLGTGWAFPPTLHGLDMDGSVKTLSLGAVSLDSVTVVNTNTGARGLAVELKEAVVDSLTVENIAKLEVDADSSVESLEATDIGACSIDGSVSSYIGETEKNLSVKRTCSASLKVR